MAVLLMRRVTADTLDYTRIVKVVRGVYPVAMEF